MTQTTSNSSVLTTFIGAVRAANRVVKGSVPTRWVVLIIVLSVVGAVTYAPGMRAGFFFDDEDNIVNASALHWRELSRTNLDRALEGAALPARPVANVSFALNHVAGGLDPFGYRVVNLAIHILVALTGVWLVVLLSRDLRPNDDDSRVFLYGAAGALIYVVHPLNIQAVTYVVQRMASLAALFSMLAMCCFIWALNARSVVERLAGVGALAACLLLAVGSKENAYIMPVVFGLYMVASGRLRVESVLRSPVAAVVLVLLVLFVFYALSRALTPGFVVWFDDLPGRDYSGYERVLTQFRVQAFYLSLVLLPLPGRLNLDHHIVASTGLLAPVTTLVCAVLVGATFVAGLWLMKRRPALGFPLVSYFLLHAIESMPISLEMVFEHRMYLPGVMLTAFVVLVALETPLTRTRLAGALVIAAALALGSASYSRNAVWGEKLAFLADSAAKSPTKFRPLYQYGTALAQDGQIDRAEDVLMQAWALEPTHTFVNNQLGNIAWIKGDMQSARWYYEQSLKSNVVNAEVQYNYARLMELTGQKAKAIEHYGIFIEAAPEYLGVQKEEAEGRIRELSR